ncbi:MAG: glycogen debranching enzyme N-terminal domain-containing protein [Candidatus Wallbacteria bacterium]|nr:glycogen debranching enzyme N-terminal domain-containing protein [Candidatus Wallbacteria bacterium]
MLSLVFGPDILHELDAALGREWLCTNGLGSSASGTLAGALTRRYHGLLTCATRPPVGRMHLVSKLSETVRLAGSTLELDTNIYPGHVHPAGYRYLTEARLQPMPAFFWRAGEFLLEKRVFMPHETQATVVLYRLAEGAGELELYVRPMMSCRDFHALTLQNDALDGEARELGEGHLCFEPYAGVPSVHVYHDGEFHPSLVWYKNLEYPAERERGLPYREDNWSPGYFRLRLTRGAPVALVLSAGPFGQWSPSAGEAAPAPRPDPIKLLEAETARRRQAAGPFTGAGGLLEALAAATDQFLVRRNGSLSVIAGYPWFEDWGRDTFISLPGLALTMERPEVACSALLEFSRYLKDGLLPNRFPDAGADPEYNTVDAPLWFIHAVGRFLEATDDLETVRQHLMPAMEQIVGSYVRGTGFGIAVDEDGLVDQGEEGQALTWMDARVDGWVVTPRRGKPVEIQALWHNALRTLESLNYELDRPERASKYGELADLVARSFLEKFWLEDRGWCADVADDPDHAGHADVSLRPNQLFAASLPHPLLDPERTKRMLDAVRSRLLTPCGLRTLASNDPRYVSKYEGSPRARDGAYHMGIAWPWLLGAYADALVHAHAGWTPEVLREVRHLLKGFEDHVAEAGLGSVSEIFEPEPPYRAVGCPQQAWSVAEMLRIAAECARHS